MFTVGVTTTARDLRALAEQAGRDLEHASAQDVIRWADETFGDGFVIASSMGDGLLASLASEVVPGVQLLFLDTGYHFAETIGTRDAVQAVYDVRVRTQLPLLTVQQQDEKYGKNLFARDPDACCAMRKVAPLAKALEDYVAWGSGIRRDESAARAAAGVVEWDDERGMVKVNPIATWTQAQAETWIAEHGVLVNPLLTDGYASIGCAPCTRRPADGEDARAGRWSGTGKVECGLHV